MFKEFFLKRFGKENQLGYRLASLLAAVVIGLGSTASYILSRSVSVQRDREIETKSLLQSNSLNAYVSQKIVTYESMLLSAATIFDIKSNEMVSKEDWKKMYNSLQISTRSPEILGIAYAESFKKDQLAYNINDSLNHNATGLRDFKISPSYEREEYTAVTHVEPFDSVNSKAIGFDMLTEKTRNAAMTLARDTGKFALSGPVIAKQDEALGTSKAPISLLLYYPVYKNGEPSSTPEQRRASLKGYVCLVFRFESIMKDKEKDLDKGEVKVLIQDVTDGKVADLYAYPDKNFDKNKKIGTSEWEQKVDNRIWKVSMFESGSKSIAPLVVFATGLGASIMLGALTLYYLAKRIAAIDEAHKDDIIRTKNELLAMASHQLRTPASAVKQYIGMLDQGYFGKLTKEQSSIIKKAYAANDRQLEVIDQILYVAKADSGQLLLRSEMVDFSELLERVVEGFHDKAQEKSININLNFKKDVICIGDERYLSMIIENLLSNAIKYSYPKSTITLSMKSDDVSVTMTVEDKGVGIDRADIGKLFQKFTRIENPLSRAEGGSGLGLFLAGRLAEALSGNIGVISRIGEGSKFTFIFPIENQYNKSVIQLTEKK